MFTSSRGAGVEFIHVILKGLASPLDGCLCVLLYIIFQDYATWLLSTRALVKFVYHLSFLRTIINMYRWKRSNNPSRIVHKIISLRTAGGKGCVSRRVNTDKIKQLFKPALFSGSTAYKRHAPSVSPCTRNHSINAACKHHEGRNQFLATGIRSGSQRRDSSGRVIALSENVCLGLERYVFSRTRGVARIS